jgi:hypothetical protein
LQLWRNGYRYKGAELFNRRLLIIRAKKSHSPLFARKKLHSPSFREKNPIVRQAFMYIMRTLCALSTLLFLLFYLLSIYYHPTHHPTITTTPLWLFLCSCQCLSTGRNLPTRIPAVRLLRTG